MKTKKLPDLARLRELLSYDPDTGALRWRVDRTGGTKAGDIAGCIDHSGGVVVKVCGTVHKGHRLAWLLQTGTSPIGVVDHINGFRSDNRWANLRDVPRAWNQQNQRRPAKGNQSGRLGVRVVGDRYQAQLKVAGRSVYLGTFDDPDSAQQAYLKAKREQHPGCTL